MSMKVRGRNGVEETVIIQQQNAGAAQRSKAEETETEASATRSDTVSLTKSQDIKNSVDLEAMAAERRAKVEDLKKQIQAGTYDFSGNKIAAGVAEGISQAVSDLKPLASE